MENKKYTLFGSKAEVFWNKTTEDRPHHSVFNNIDWEWEEFPIVFSFLDTFTSKMTLKEDTYTYFKLLNSETGITTYWFVTKKEKILSKGVVYILEMDLYSSFVIDALNSINRNALVGVSRTHLKWEEYIKYVLPYINDELVSNGSVGEGPSFIKGPVKWEYVIDGNYTGVEIPFTFRNKNTGGTTTDVYRHDGTWGDNKLFPVTRCYVFYQWDPSKDTTPDENKKSGGPVKKYIIVPVIETKDAQTLYTKNKSNPNNLDKTLELGNLENNIQYLVKKYTNRFLGVYTIPLMNVDNVLWESIVIPKTEGSTLPLYSYYYLTMEFGGENYSHTIDDLLKVPNNNDKYDSVGRVVLPTEVIEYNDPKTEFEGDTYGKVNFYTFLNINNIWYKNVISPQLYFKPSNNTIGFTINLDGQLIFSDGFRVFHNPYDNILYYGSKLPVDNQSYEAYINGLRQTMNAAIKASSDNTILNSIKNVNSFAIATGQITSGFAALFNGNNEGEQSVHKGLSGVNNAFFNIVGGIVNHFNTKNMYKAQLEDAKNSIPPNITTTNEDDLKIYLTGRGAGEVIDGSKTSVVLLKRMNKRMVNYNNNLAFLFGVSIKNYIPWIIFLRNYSSTLPCFYIEFTKDYAVGTFYNIVNRKWPKLELETKIAICDAMTIGYRIWMRIPDLTSNYTMDLRNLNSV